MQKVSSFPEQLDILPVKNSVKQLYFKGELSLLKRPMVSIVGTRKPCNYTKEMTTMLAQRFASAGYVVVSGAAMGVDALAHKAAFPNTIAVMANSLDIIYPKINQRLIEGIFHEGLALSEYDAGTRATKYSFVVRNRIVVALGEFLIITEADEKSGTMRSAEIALELGKKIYVLPHRLGESRGTQKLLREGNAELILDIDDFVAQFGEVIPQEEDPLLSFCQKIPSLHEAVAQFGDQVYEYELEGLVEIKNLKVYPL
jgi:DNA processing protein